MYELAYAGDLPLPNSTPPYSNKRERGADSPVSANTNETISSSSLSPDVTRNIAGSRRVRESMQQSPPVEQNRLVQPQGVYTLPVYSEELGRLPVHGQVAFSPQGRSPSNNSPFSYWNHATSHDVNIPGGSLSARPSQPYLSKTNSNAGGSSFSMDGLMADSTGLNYNTFVQESFLSASLGATSTNPSIHSTRGDPHRMGGQGISDMANTQAMIDNDAIAMWSNAPSGFEYVNSSITLTYTHLCVHFSLDDWGAYLTNVSELTHGQHPINWDLQS
jgi:hypothetical protein